MSRARPSITRTNAAGTHGIGRAQFMERIRRALKRSADDSAVETPRPPAVDEALVRLAGPGDGLVDLFARQAEAAGMVVHRTTAGALADDGAAVLRSSGARRVAISMSPGALADAAREAARLAGASAVPWRESAGLEGLYDADVGMTDADAAIAETGSVVVSSDAHHSRGGFLVPPVHVAIVPASRIVPDMIDFWRLRDGLGGAPLPAATVFITGPSKTADIEGILITGVHGPGRVHVVLVGDA